MPPSLVVKLPAPPTSSLSRNPGTSRKAVNKLYGTATSAGSAPTASAPPSARAVTPGRQALGVSVKTQSGDKTFNGGSNVAAAPLRHTDGTGNVYDYSSNGPGRVFKTSPKGPIGSPGGPPDPG